MSSLPSTDEQGGEGVDPAAVGAVRTACSIAPVGVDPPAGGDGRRGAPPRCATAADPTGDVTAGGETPATSSATGREAAGPTAAATSTVISADVEPGAPCNCASSNNTFDRNCAWRCAPWAFLLVFLLSGIVYFLIGHKFR
ncbi:hypothetical protein CKAN_02064400 [Cinnamomum micranthum f. kanehirae]|uniref:Uncharacterized protein n=1 Tax=Cinnamomum micranthum f. kanehirae TaxID=337451 RepID=A0A443PL53_9MAGN|nr:hypothetical protein CKAN_02064400 [Cinnamomum micranthum f. kanehirae]